MAVVGQPTNVSRTDGERSTHPSTTCKKAARCGRSMAEWGTVSCTGHGAIVLWSRGNAGVVHELEQLCALTMQGLFAIRVLVLSHGASGNGKSIAQQGGFRAATTGVTPVC